MLNQDHNSSGMSIYRQVTTGPSAYPSDPPPIDGRPKKGSASTVDIATLNAKWATYED